MQIIINVLLDEKPIFKNLLVTQKQNLNFRDSQKVEDWFKKFRPEIVIIAAAKVGGILANKNNPVEFLLENLRIQNNLIESSWKYGAKKLLFLGSSCIYPKFAKQPIQEKYLLSDHLEDTNQWYAIAKIAGLKLCEAYRKQYAYNTISLMPTNLYGPGDNYHPSESHVIAGLIRKFHEANYTKNKKVICWGSGNPLREFLYVEDFAEACIYVLNNWNPSKDNAPLDDEGNPLNWLNVGSEFEISIKELANSISDIIGFNGEIIWDVNKPDGTPRKKLDTTFINKLGWQPKTNLKKGLKKTIINFQENYEKK